MITRKKSLTSGLLIILPLILLIPGSWCQQPRHVPLDDHLQLNTSSAIRRYRRVLLPASHPLRAPSQSFGQPSLLPAPGHAVIVPRTRDQDAGIVENSPLFRNTEKQQRPVVPVRPRYAGFEDSSYVDRRSPSFASSSSTGSSSSGVRYSVDHGDDGRELRPVLKVQSVRTGSRDLENPRIISSSTASSSPANNKRRTQQRPAAASSLSASFDRDLGSVNDFRSGGRPSSQRLPDSGRASAFDPDFGSNEGHNDEHKNEENEDEILATFNPLREISQADRIQFLFRDETFPKSNGNNNRQSSRQSTTSPAIVPKQSQRPVASSTTRNRVNDRSQKPTSPQPFSSSERTTPSQSSRTPQSFRNDFREYVAAAPPVTRSLSPATRFPTAVTQWPSPPTPPSNGRSSLSDHQREALLLKDLRDEDNERRVTPSLPSSSSRHSSQRQPLPSTLSYTQPTSRPSRDRDNSNSNTRSHSYYPEEEVDSRSTSRSSPPPPPSLPRLQRVSAPRQDHHRPSSGHESRIREDNNDDDISDRRPPAFSLPGLVSHEVTSKEDERRSHSLSGHPRLGGESDPDPDKSLVNNFGDDLGEIAGDPESFQPPTRHDPRPRQHESGPGSARHESRTPELRPHQPPPPPQQAVHPSTRLPSRIEFPSHRELSTVVISPVTQPSPAASDEDDAWNSGRSSRQGRRIRPAKQEDREEPDVRLPERPERPERPAKPVIIIKQLTPSPPPVTTPAAPVSRSATDGDSESYLKNSFVRGAAIDHGVPLGLSDYPIEDLRSDTPVGNPVDRRPEEDDDVRQTRPPPPPPPPQPTRKRSRGSRRRNKNKKSENSGRVQQRLSPNYNRPASRPRNEFPTPVPMSQATKCDPKVCRLPDCNCGQARIPGGLKVRQVPQIILLTFDDAINDLNWELYQEIFHSGRKNPNGCPPLGTFYVSHEWTDYAHVQTLYSRGHEMASHGVTHSFGEKFSTRQWAKEIVGQREVLHLYGGVKLEDVRGMRAPFLQVGGNRMFEMLYDANFTYDSSMPVFDNRPPFFPYTLDYALNHECMITPCPTKSFPGLWEVGMVMWEDLNGGRCSMGDACQNPTDEDGVHRMLMKNFRRHYESNRAPFGLYYHSAWFSNLAHRKGFLRFMDEILQMPDVFFTTNWQMIQWMRDPTPVDQISSFEPFRCDVDRDLPDACDNPVVCNIPHETQGIRYMKTCQPCPDSYPWVGNTGFEKRILAS